MQKIKILLFVMVMSLATNVVAEEGSIASAESAGVSDIRTSPENILVVLFGDEYIGSKHVPFKYNFRTRLENHYRGKGYKIDVADRSVEELTTQYALEILEKNVLSISPDVVIIEIGLYDYLNKLPLEKMQYNLDILVWNILNNKPDTQIVIVGQRATTLDVSKEYKEAYEEIYAYIAGRYQIPLYPRYTDKIANYPMYFKGTGKYPNGFGTKTIIDIITPYIDGAIHQADNNRYSEMNR